MYTVSDEDDDEDEGEAVSSFGLMVDMNAAGQSGLIVLVPGNDFLRDVLPSSNFSEIRETSFHLSAKLT